MQFILIVKNINWKIILLPENIRLSTCFPRSEKQDFCDLYPYFSAGLSYTGDRNIKPYFLENCICHDYVPRSVTTRFTSCLEKRFKNALLR